MSRLFLSRNIEGGNGRAGVVTNVTVIPVNPLLHEYHLHRPVIVTRTSGLTEIYLRVAMPARLLLIVTRVRRYVTEVGAICEKIAFAANVTAPGAAVLVRYEDDAHYPVDKVTAASVRPSASRTPCA
jgi:vancomycin permeability regulator SanA